MRLQETLQVRLEPDGVRIARDAVRARLVEWDLPVDRDLVALLLSEAVTNAVVHGGPPSSIRLTWEVPTLRISVRDGLVGSLPVISAGDPHAENGRGLALLAALADRWGIAVGERSKTVWFEVRSAPEEKAPEGNQPEQDALGFEAFPHLPLRQAEGEPGRRYDCGRVRGQRVQLVPNRRPTCTLAPPGGSTAITASQSRRMPASI